jgi:hypothetical protein
MCVEELCGVPWKQPRFRLQSDSSRSVDCLLNAYSLEMTEDHDVYKFNIVQETCSRARKTALDVGLEFRCGTVALRVAGNQQRQMMGNSPDRLCNHYKWL